MKIKVFENFSFEYPEDAIVCLYKYNVSDINNLINFIERLITDENYIGLNLSEESFIQSDMNLIFKLNRRDIGIEKKDLFYVCSLTISSYKKMVEFLINHKIDIKNTHCWLYDTSSKYEFLISYDCKW